MLPFPKRGDGTGCWRRAGGVWLGSGGWPGRDGLGGQTKRQKRGLRIPFRYARIKKNVGQQMRHWVRSVPQRGMARIECRKASRKAAGRDRRPIFDN
jgi:hypothetical protein